MTAFTSWSARHRPDGHPRSDTVLAAPASWRIRTSLAVLVVACLLPGLLLSSYFIVSDYREHKARAIRDVIATARATAASLDRDLASIESGLRVLASSTALANDDLAAFHAQARSALPFQNITNVVLIDPEGRQQVNTLRSWGTPLPTAGGPLQSMRIFSHGTAVLTDVFTGPVTGKPIVALGVPVQRGDNIVYSLNAGIFPDRVAGVLSAQRLPRDWIGAVLDSQGRIVARTHDMARYVAQPAVPDLVRAAREQREGVIETNTLEDIPVVTAFTRSNVSGWTVAIGLPREELTAGLKHALALLLAASTAVFALGLWVAWRLAVSRVVVPIDRLLASMARISRGEHPASPAETAPRGISQEFQSLDEGLSAMSQRLIERDRERDALLQRLTHTLESIHDGFFQLDDTWRFAYVNRRAEALLQQPRDALLGRTPWGALAPEDAAALRASFESAVARQQPVHLETRLPTLRLWLDIHAYPSGQGLGVYFQDVGEQHAARQARQAQQVAEASNQAKTEFLSRMSHELRTPLNAILGFAQLLHLDTTRTLTDSQAQQVQWILSAGQQLLALVEDVLDLTKVEAGEIRMNLQPVDVGPALAASLAMLDGVATRHEVRFIDRLPASPLRVLADPQRLQQVLVNLLSNGCKYNRPGGHVTIDARQDGDDVVIQITDNGIGMAPEDAAQLFQPFKRVVSSAHYIEGTGLGLYIVKQLVERMRGDVTVDTREGLGSCFTLRLPAVAIPPG